MSATRWAVAVVSVLLTWIVITTAMNAWGTTRIAVVLETLTLLTLAVGGGALALYGWTATDAR